MPLHTFIENSIWIKDYPVRYAGCDLHARMVIIRLLNGKLFLHSPCKITARLKEEIKCLGTVEFIVAPGTFHYLHILSAQQAFPEAEILICPGVEQKLPELEFDWFLGDKPDPRLAEDFAQVLVHGSRIMTEVVFFHKPSRTLLLVDLIENITDETPDSNRVLKFWWKIVFHMWNHPKPAPEYQMGWKNKRAAQRSLNRILKFDFDKIILAHGDLILSDAKVIAQQAWYRPLHWKVSNKENDE